MAVAVVRLGTPRADDEGLRLGTVRRPPRGVRKSDFATRDFYDVWMPELAPSASLLAWWFGGEPTPERWTVFARRYRAEMEKPPARRLIALLSALSRGTNFSVGCYCEVEARCHRSLLRGLLADAGATLR
jgi:uncharacterized protein YeaO (DUF488 family)